MMRRIFLFILIAISFAGCASMKYRNAPWFEQIPSFNTQVVRVIPVPGSSFSAELTGWEHRDGMWYLMQGPWKAVVGEHGFAEFGEKQEGDKMTPMGIFPITRAFGRYLFCPSRLPYTRMTKNDIWIDDPASPKYNTLSKLPSDVSHEMMLRKDGLYDYGAVIGYNTNPVAQGKGSAIFLHVWRDGGKSPTAGCVAVSRTHMMELLSWLSKDREPVILLGQIEIEDKKNDDKK